MNIQIRYHSKGGNTKKLAVVVATALDAEAMTADVPVPAGTDILFLLGALYAGHPAPELIECIARLDTAAVGRIAILSNAASKHTIFDELKAAAEQKGIPVEPECFSCRGKFLFVHRRRPDADDLSAAAAFARKIRDK